MRKLFYVLGFAVIPLLSPPLVFASGSLVDAGTGFPTPYPTQPVSLTSLPPLAAGSAVIGHVVTDSGSVSACTESGSWTVVLGAGSAVVGHVIVDTAPSTAVTGTFWQATQPVSGTFWQATQPVSLASLPSLATGSNVIGHVLTDSGSVESCSESGTWTVGLNAGSAVIGHVIVDTAPTTAVTGTFWQATQPVSGTVTITPPTLTKGTQGATGLSTQDLKDAGRTFVTLTADAISGVTSNTVVTFSKNVNGTVTATQTSYTITSGKTFRVQSVHYNLKSAAAAIAFAKIYLRLNTAGACVAGSGILDVLPEINTNSATSGTGAWLTTDYPDGLEIAGDGTKAICLSHLDQATTNIVGITLVGYEY